LNETFEIWRVLVRTVAGYMHRFQNLHVVVFSPSLLVPARDSSFLFFFPLLRILVFLFEGDGDLVLSIFFFHVLKLGDDPFVDKSFLAEDISKALTFDFKENMGDTEREAMKSSW
jgi:hypothetical protein